MPTVKKNETENEFMRRCMKQLVVNEGKDQKQAGAICFSLYRESKKKKGTY